MIFRTNDPVRDAERYDRRQARQERELPLCDYCDQRIQDDFLYEINGDTICEECLKDNFRKKVEV